MVSIVELIRGHFRDAETFHSRCLPAGIAACRGNHSTPAFGPVPSSTVNGTGNRNQRHRMIPMDGDAVSLRDPFRILDVSLGCEGGLWEERDGDNE